MYIHIPRKPFVIACLVVSLAWAGCRAKAPITRTWLPMGTVATLTFSRTMPPVHVEAHFHAVTSVVHDIERAMSVYIPASDISRLNAAAGEGMVPISTHTRRTLEAGIAYAEGTGGAFDPTVAPLVNLWGFHQRAVPLTPPTPEELHTALRTVGYRHVVISNSAAALRRPGMRIDLGGIAKGYAVDQGFDALVRANIQHFMLDIGGNLRVRGTSRPNKPWTIGIRNPFESGRIIGTLQLPSGMAVATSGNYERFVTIEGRRYAHIIDPRTGMPVQGMAGVTVVCPSATQADALSTALFVLGPTGAREVLAAQPECHALFVPDRHPLQIHITPGMRPLFKPLPAHADQVTTRPAL